MLDSCNNLKRNHRRGRPHKPIQITVNGDPLACGTRNRTAEFDRASAFFAANPSRNFYWVRATHAQVRAMARTGVVFAAHFDYGRYPVQQHAAVVPGPGPHALLFRHDWHARSLLQGKPIVPPGCLIRPNFAPDHWGHTDEEQELSGLALWFGWESAEAPTPWPEFDHTSDNECSPRSEAIDVVHLRGNETLRSKIGHLVALW